MSVSMREQLEARIVSGKGRSWNEVHDIMAAKENQAAPQEAFGFPLLL